MATAPVALIDDDRLESVDRDGVTYPFGGRGPEPGELLTIMPGIRWWRVPMSGPLKHVNGLVLDDVGGVAVIDTGTASPRSSEAWKTMLAGPLADTRVTRVICTHMHPDHIGLAGWLCRRFAAPLVMTRTEWLTARMLSADQRSEQPPEMMAFWRAAGWDEEQVTRGAGQSFDRFGRMIARLPLDYTRIREGDRLTIGAEEWEVVVGSGHSPEHACLLNHQRRVLIAGDQVLPRISSNVSLQVSEPGADPLGEWLDSIEKLKHLPDDLLILPGHGDPFYGLHARLDALATEHRERLDALVIHMDQPRRATDCFAQLFRRPIGPDVLGMATGEALAHLRHLEVSARAVKTVNDGVWWYSRA